MLTAESCTQFRLVSTGMDLYVLVQAWTGMVLGTNPSSDGPVQTRNTHGFISVFYSMQKDIEMQSNLDCDREITD